MAIKNDQDGYDIHNLLIDTTNGCIESDTSGVSSYVGKFNLDRDRSTLIWLVVGAFLAKHYDENIDIGRVRFLDVPDLLKGEKTDVQKK